MRRWWLTAGRQVAMRGPTLAAAAVVGVATLTVLLGSAWSAVVQAAAAAAMTASFAVSAGTSRTRQWRRSWSLFAAWGAASTVACLLLVAGTDAARRWASVCFVAAVVPALAGLTITFGGLYRRGGLGRAFADGWLYVGSLLAIALGLVIGQAVPDDRLTAPAVLVGQAFVGLNLLVVAMFAGVAMGTAGGTRARARLVAVAVAVMTVGDAMALAATLGRPVVAGLANALGVGAYGLLALVPVTGRADGYVPATRRLSVPEAIGPFAVAFVAVTGINAWALLVGSVSPVLLALLVSLFVALIVRQASTVRENLRLLRRLAEREDHFRSLVLDSTDVILVVDDDGRVDYASPAVTGMLGRAPEDLQGVDLESLVHPRDVPAVRQAAGRVLRDPADRARLPVRFASADAGWRHTETTLSHRGREYVVNVRDVSEQRVLSAELERLAFHDPLTGLANRARFMDTVRGSLARRRRAEALAVLFLDLDGFKDVNDTAGHDAGDTLLVEVAERLHRTVGPGDVVARWGGDEFAVLVERRPDPASVQRVAAQVLAALTRPYRVADREYSLGASVGVALAGAGGDDPPALLRSADLAMYRAKQLGKRRVEVFAPGLLETALSRVDVESRLVRALADQSLGLRYQPVVDLTTGRPVALEALVRWTDQDGRPGMADELVRVAEESGRIDGLGRFVLDRALAQASAWRAVGLPVDLAVNLSARQVTAPGLLALLSGVLERTGLPPRSVTLEITESVLIEGVEPAVERLAALRGLGVRLVLDDFGTGYSSLAYLSQLPVDGLKLDRSFVTRIGASPAADVLVGGVLRIARELGLDVTAEGVETAEQAATLLTLGCDRAQGYLFSPPVGAPVVPWLMTRAVLPVPPTAAWTPVSDGASDGASDGVTDGVSEGETRGEYVTPA